MDIILETSRLILRRFTSSDADASLIYELNSNPEVVKYLHEPILRDSDHALEILTNTILPQYKQKLGRWAIQLKEGNDFIGWCGLKNRPELNEIDLGYRFMQSAWGKGFATEAAAAVLNYGLNTLYLQRIVGRAHVENAASLSVLQKIGMTYIADEFIDGCPVKTFEALSPAS